MSKKLTLTVNFEFNAPKSKVWTALTDPEIIKQYFFGTELKADWKVGGLITFSGEWDGTPYIDKGIILEYEFESLLVYDYLSSFSGKADIPENYAKISYQVTEKTGKTTLQITQDGIENEESLNHSKENWIGIMEGMRAFVE
jgi:uncharacterized protein YndB with AHSA1/START domain